VFNFAVDGPGKLVVSEIFLGEKVRTSRVATERNCKCSKCYHTSCCPLGDKILVMAGERNATDFFCALVSIDPGELNGKSIHLEEKRVIGWESYRCGPFLVQISENKVWASFYYSDEMWIGELKGDEVIMAKHQDKLPMAKGFGAPPLRLPDGRLLIAGECPICTDIILITQGEHFSFEKIGDVPGEGGYGASTILIKERFVVGFGGRNRKPIDDMWIFDLQTKEASPVTKGGKWHPATPWPFLAVKEGILYIVGGNNNTAAHSTTLQHLSELIQDLDFQPVFQAALGLELRQYPTIPQKGRQFRGMRDLGGSFPRHFPRNTVDHQGRVLHFSRRKRKLCVTEILIGPWVKTRTVNTRIDCKNWDDNNISCCSFGDKILVMAAKRNATSFFCALVTIDPGELSRESIHLEEKKVTGFQACKLRCYSIQTAENKVWVSFNRSSKTWVGEIKGDELAMTKRPGHLPTGKKIGVSPLRLPDGSFLVAGQSLSSTALLLITLGEQLCFQELGDIPGTAREGASTVLAGERFVVGFGGMRNVASLEPDYVDAMWILDLKSHRVSSVKREGEWHPGGRWPVLVVRNQELYVIGGGATTAAHSLSFAALVRLIQNGRVRCAFCSWLGLQFWFGASLHRSTVMYYAPHWL